MNNDDKTENKSTPALSKFQLESLATVIYNAYQYNFQMVHLSGNLADTMKIVPKGDAVEIHIPAKRYNMAEYRRTKAIVYNGKGSYAQKVNQTGGFSGIHKGYIENGILSSITEYLAIIGKKGEVSIK